MIADPLPLDLTSAGAVFSLDRRFRYRLWRIWDPDRLCVTFLMLNPSIADEQELDPTLRRCMAFAKSWGYGGMQIVNVFPMVSTDPRALRADGNGWDRDGARGGHRNLDEIIEVARSTSKVILGFGSPAMHPDLRYALKRLRICLPDAYALCVNKDGSPTHPLYLPAKCTPEPYFWPETI